MAEHYYNFYYLYSKLNNKLCKNKKLFFFFNKNLTSIIDVSTRLLLFAYFNFFFRINILRKINFNFYLEKFIKLNFITNVFYY